MITYLLKTIGCSGLLLLAYYLLLEKEKMHRFNRFYLLLSIVAAFIIPLITLPVKAEIFPVTETMVPLNIAVFEAPEVADNPLPLITTPDTIETQNWWPALIVILYLVVSAIVLLRFLRNLLKITTSIRQHTTVKYQGARLVLTNYQQVPHTFLHYIFLHKNDYENGLIEKEILCHEMVHVRQKHSLDVLFTELLLIFFWFNPVLYFYRKTIRLNHEFLADAAVVEAFQNPTNYQQLLLQSASQPGSMLPASALNYSITKKRLIMMTRNTSLKIAFAKQLVLLPFVAAMILLFSTKVSAQDTIKLKQQERKQIESSKEDAPAVIIERYAAILSKYNLNTKEGWKNFHLSVTQSDREKLEFLYERMSKAQQSEQKVGFMPSPGLAIRSAPTASQFTDFKNSEIYGVWINDKKVINTVLNKYAATDFILFDVSKLYGAAKKNKSYSYQVTLETKDQYQKYYNLAIAEKDKNIMFVKWLGKIKNDMIEEDF